ncbi:hypothetical protein MRBLMI12_003745 [Microbacterium sp. LMI12-1-1.1]|uniref:hypothetical protein n=1 Tax=Microbacterium sp. LMI12-1-1.1 TaxID=3135225 RepID=UPI003421B72B
MNDDLTPYEQSEMRDLVLAGAQRIRPAGRHRMQLVAGAVALVLIGVVSGGAITTAALLGSDARPAPAPTTSETRPAPSPSPTPETTPAPTPTPSPPTPVVSAAGVTPFAGECANALDEASVEAVAKIDMMLSDYRWKTGANEVLGGIDCVWVSDGVYLAATAHLMAYPEAVVDDALQAGTATGCAPVTEDGTQVECTEAGVVGGTWMVVRAAGEKDSVTAPGVAGLFAEASRRLADHPAPTPAARTAEWWALPDCAAIVASIDPAVYGFERVALLAQSSRGEATERLEGVALFAGAASWCELHFTSGSGDTTSGEVVRVDVVPGGAIAFQTALDAADAQPVTVDGAEAAVIAPGLDRYEGSGSVVVATDGVNVLMVTPDFIRSTTDALPLTAAVLALMRP